MKQNMVNNVEVRGYVFSHTLQAKVSGPNSKNPGTPFIQGEINVAKSMDAMDVVPVHFSYVTENLRSGAPNQTYQNLMKLINDGQSKTIEGGSDNPNRVRISGAIEVNDFYDREDNLRSPKRIRGGFIHFLNANEQVGEPEKAVQFNADVILFDANLREVENGEDYYQVRGYTFAFNNAAIPVELTVCKEGVAFFEKLGIDQENPYFGNVWGTIKSNVIEIQQDTDDSDIGFGEIVIRPTTRTFRSWEITGAKQPQEIDESTITLEELQKLLEDRAVYLAGVKKRSDEWRASQQGQQGFPASNPIGTAKKASDFKF